MKPYRQYINNIRDNVSKSLDIHGESNKQNNINLNNSFNCVQSTNQFAINLNNSQISQNNQSQTIQQSNRYKQNNNYGLTLQEKRINQKRPTTNSANRNFIVTNNRGVSLNNSLSQSPQQNENNYVNNTISYDQNINRDNNMNAIYNNYLNNTISTDKDVRKYTNHVRSYSSTNNYNDKQEKQKNPFGQRQVNSSMENNHPDQSFNSNNTNITSLLANGLIQIHQKNSKSHQLNLSRNGNRGGEDSLNNTSTTANTKTPHKISTITPRENNILRKINVITNTSHKIKKPISPKNDSIQVNNLNNFQIQLPQSTINITNSQNCRNTITSSQRKMINPTQKQQKTMKQRQNSKHNYTFTNYLNQENTKCNQVSNSIINGINHLNSRLQIQSYNLNTFNNKSRNNSGQKNISSKVSIQQLICNQKTQHDQGQSKKQKSKCELQDQNQIKQQRQIISLNGLISNNNSLKLKLGNNNLIQEQAPKNMQDYLSENSIENINFEVPLSINSSSKENYRPHNSIQKDQLNILNQKRYQGETSNRNGVNQQRRLKSSQGKYGRSVPNTNNRNIHSDGIHSSLDTYQSILETKEKSENALCRSLNISTIDNSLLEQNLPTFQFTISHRTKQGVLASNPNKTNQDSFIIIQNLNNKSNQHFFAVCDGHGSSGHHVSQYIKQQLPEIIQNDQQLLVNNPKAALFNSIGIANHKLSLTDIECNFSGTTLVSVLLQGSKLYSANVGDSRATIGCLGQNGIHPKYVPRPLTRDHKPGIEGESERIIQCGGRIDTFRDQEGNHLGPQRVWLKNENIPGLAMSRSIGDNIATSVGVTWEPEIFEFDINQNDKFMIVASDGVWEFIENEEIINMISPFYDNNDIEGACDHVLKESHARWTVDDDSVIDDITLIIIFFDHQKNQKQISRPNSRQSSSQRNTKHLSHSVDDSYYKYNSINNIHNQSFNN